MAETQGASPTYRIPAEALVTCWAGDRLLVFSRRDENTHVLASPAGRLVMALLSRDGVPLSVQEMTRACGESEELLQDPEMAEQFLNDLHQAGIVEQCPGT